MTESPLELGKTVFEDRVENSGLVWIGLDAKPDVIIIAAKGVNQLVLNREDDFMRVVVDFYVDYFDQKVYGRAYHPKSGATRWYLMEKANG